MFDFVRVFLGFEALMQVIIPYMISMIIVPGYTKNC
jgi:hypothetical protein